MVTVIAVNVILHSMSSAIAAPCNTNTNTVPTSAIRAQQLIAASQRHTHDPFEEIDWNVAIDDSAYHLPPELLALYATPTWEQMSESERITYSRHETAAMFAAGIWFENA